jgi:starch-binding outer membrane protein, SusD/RagB family
MRMHRTPIDGAPGRVRMGAVGTVLAGSLVLWGCDLGVSSPALIPEDDLFVPEAAEFLVNGARYTFNNAITGTGAGGVISVSAALTDELTHVGSWVPPREISNGEPGNESPENQSHWGQSSRARWQAEDAVNKMNQVLDNPGSNPWMALGLLYAGFSNRLLGDMFCEAVIDGGSLQPHTAFHERGEGHFTNAIQVADNAGRADYRNAAYAGRAQVRMMLGDWAGAVADADQVPTDFTFVHPMSDNSGAEGNGVFEWAALTSGQYSVWATPFAEWGLDVTGTLETEGDPRAAFRHRPNMGGGSPQRPYYFIEKYTSRNDDIAIAKGTEMRLIEAEALLRGGNVDDAVDKINEVRAHHGLADASAANAAEAWELLMKERGLELWLEGRRLPDLRRWAANADTRARITTTAWRLGEVARPVYDATPFCLRISTNEIFSNPNLANNPPT